MKQGFGAIWIVGVVAVALLAAGVWYMSGRYSTSPSPTSTTTPTGGGTIAPHNSGISGTLTLGPTCPVERDPPDPNCADKPFQTLVAIYRASDLVHAVVITKSNAEGKFSASLPPGDYTVGAGESNLPRCNITPVSVKPNSYSDITISCDTGIR